MPMRQMGPLRSFLRQDMGGAGKSPQEDILRDLERQYHAQEEPEMPAALQAPRMGQMPQRQKMSALELIPQALAGVGDVVGAGRGIRPQYLQQVMGMGERGREQNFRDQLASAAQQYEESKMQYEDLWRRYGAQSQQIGRRFDKALKLHELKLMQEMIRKQQGGVDEQAKLERMKAEAQAREALKDVSGVEELQEKQAQALQAAQTPEAYRVFEEETGRKALQFQEQAQQKEFSDLIESMALEEVGSSPTLTPFDTGSAMRLAEWQKKFAGARKRAYQKLGGKTGPTYRPMPE